MEEAIAENVGQDFPRVCITANVSADGRRIELVFPQEFIKETIAIAGDAHGRHRIILGPVYSGLDIVGFVSPNGVKYGKVEINPAAYDLRNLIPSKTSRYWGKQREGDILVGRLLTELCAQADRPHVVHALPSREQVQRIEAVREAVMTIEAAVDFVNEWVAANQGQLVIEANTLAIEIQKRIGGKKHG